MRILHIYKDYFPVVGGIENHVKWLAEAQAAQGHSVTVLVTSRTRTPHLEIMNGVRVIFAARLFNLSSAPFSLELFEHARAVQADIIHLHAPYPVGEMAYWLTPPPGRAVLTYHSDIVRQRVMGALYTPLLHLVLARVDRIIATSPNYNESSPVLRRWRDKCLVVPLGIPIAAFESVPSERAVPSNPSGVNLLFVGQLRYYKGLNYLIEALPGIPNANLTVVGTGPMEQAWKTLAEQCRVAARVHWAGQVSDADLPAYYAACDIFVLPCSERSEAFGAVQLEAMASARPVVSCDVNTGVAWVNQTGVTGVVVPPKDPAALAEALTTLAGDPARRQQMGEAGRARVQQEFTIERMTDQVMTIYAGVLALPGRAG